MTPANRVTVSIKASDSCPSSAVLARKWRAGAEVDAGATNISLVAPASYYYATRSLALFKTWYSSTRFKITPKHPKHSSAFFKCPFYDNITVLLVCAKKLRINVLHRLVCGSYFGQTQYRALHPLLRGPTKSDLASTGLPISSHLLPVQLLLLSILPDAGAGARCIHRLGNDQTLAACTHS